MFVAEEKCFFPIFLAFFLRKSHFFYFFLLKILTFFDFDSSRAPKKFVLDFFFVYAKFCGIEFTYFYFQVNPRKNSHFIEFQSFNWDPKSKGGSNFDKKSPFFNKNTPNTQQISQDRSFSTWFLCINQWILSKKSVCCWKNQFFLFFGGIFCEKITFFTYFAENRGVFRFWPMTGPKKMVFFNFYFMQNFVV